MAARTAWTLDKAIPPRRARLPGYRLAFNVGDGRGQAFANIVEPGDGVLGVLYWCSQREIEALDVFESCYDRRPVAVLDETDTRIEAVAYIARPGPLTTTDRPTAEYVHRIIRGAREHGLPEEYIRAVEVLAGVGD
jgi:hypothetical protein